MFGELDFGGNYLLKDPNPDDPPGTTYIFDQLDGDMSVGVVATDKKYETKTIIYTNRTFWGAFWGDDTGYDVLDRSTDFFAGWADFLTLGGSSYIRYWTGSSEFVNEDSGWYLAGGLTGTLVVAVASGGAGFGMMASRGVVGGLFAYDAVSALHGIGKSAYNAYQGTFTGWDLMSFLPIAGYGIGKFGKHVGGRSLGNSAGKVDDVVDPRGIGNSGVVRLWNQLDEVADPTIVRQLHDNACGPACGATLLRGRGLDVGVSNVALANKGVTSFSTRGLAKTLNKLDEGAGWIGGRVAQNSTSFARLSKNGPFATTLWARGMPLEHMVVVNGLDDLGRVIIRDPADGLRYLMEWDDFMKLWTGNSIYR